MDSAKAICESHIVVVEDDIDVRETLAEVLGEEGFSVSAFAGGHAALEALNGMNVMPALILMDLMMPVMDGFEFRRALGRVPKLADVPTVVLSADSSSDDKLAALGVSGHLRKPIHIKALLDLVEKFCQAPKS